jgi:CheY-like chemotaxis protein
MRLVTTSRTVDARMAADVRNARRQRLGGVTHFAGRLAHDFTNLYTVLQSRLELMRDRLEGDVRHDLEAAFEAVERATELVRDLRALGGREAMALEPARLERLVEDMLPILRARASVRLQWRPAAGDVSLPVLADRAALEATLLTLVRNASEATSAEVEIALSVEAVHLDVPLVELHGEVPPGDWAVVRCRDNGPGISDAVLDRIFEPDFSSKGEQVETGLGLPVALARMQRMLGHLSVARHDDGGTLVSLWLPITRAVPVEAASGEATPVEATSVEATSVEATSVEATPAKAVPVEARSRLEARDAASSDCRARVLLVDDDVLVLRTAQRLLERAGFCVRTAAGGAEAERCLDDAREPIDVIVTDVVMPGLSGPALIARRRAGGDARPVVFMSGYTSDAMPVAPLPEASAPLVAKPFTTTTLVSAIQRAITGAGPAA